MEERTIRVNGRKKMFIQPDVVKINMELVTVKSTYEEAISEASVALNELRKCLGTVGFEKDDIKTVDFRVNTKYDNIKDENGNYKRVFVGYEVYNRLVIEFAQNPVTLAKVLNVISSCKATPEFFVSYDLQDDNEFKNVLLVGAIDDATEKAKVMANAAGVRLGKILNMYFGESTVGNLKGLALLAKDSGPALDLDPESLQGEANVTMVWKIEG